MPVYEYQCEACGGLTEALRRMADADAPLACEKCGSDRTRRAHSVTAAVAAGRESAGGSLPIAAGGGCCPCGKPQSACGM